MTSLTTDEFWQGYRRLPANIRRTAVRAYKLWEADHYHPSLHFKRVNSIDPFYSVRIGIHYRAVGLKEENQEMITWFFIGTHAEYDRLLAGLG